MKIIDAHLHLFPAGNELTDKMVKSVGHENSAEHLRKVYGELNMAHGIALFLPETELGTGGQRHSQLDDGYAHSP